MGKVAALAVVEKADDALVDRYRSAWDRVLTARAARVEADAAAARSNARAWAARAEVERAEAELAEAAEAAGMRIGSKMTRKKKERVLAKFVAQWDGASGQ